MLDQDELRRCFTYDNGVLRWQQRSDRTPQWNGRYAGTIAGAIAKNGYRWINIFGRPHKASRLIWTFFNGDPGEFVYGEFALEG